MVRTIRRLPRGGVLGLLIAAGLSSAADARIHSLSGNARIQVGNGLPLPIGFTAVPGGRIQAVGGATIRLHGAHAASDPASVVLDPAQLTHPGTPQVIPIFGGPAPKFQVKTAIPLQFPASKVAFAAGRRTGAATVTFCPGSIVTPIGNPGCTNPSGGAIPGMLRYTRTSQQFGGPARFAAQGTANGALNAGVSAPCAQTTQPACLAIFFPATPASRPALGGPFGAGNVLPRPAPTMGLFRVTVTTAGRIVGITPTGLGAGLSNMLTSFGGPWTTGRVTIVQPAALGGAETFVFSGSDARAATVSSTPLPSSQTPNGTGALSLVAGGLSRSAISGSNADRGWLNVAVGPRLSHVPLLPAHGVAGLVGLVAVAGVFLLRRARH